MRAVMGAEIALGYDPVDVSRDNVGYDILSRDLIDGKQRFIEVKGRRAGADTVTLTRNEILTAINSPEQFILAIVEVEDGQGGEPRYIRKYPFSTPDFGVASVNYNIRELLSMSEEPG